MPDDASPAEANPEEDPYARFGGMMADAEGVRPKVYRDSRGILTVGIGHKVLPKADCDLATRSGLTGSRPCSERTRRRR